MAGLTLSGLASGMDTDSVISQLMAIESQGKTRLLGQQYRSEARKTAFDQIATKLRSLKTAVDDLRSVSTWKNVQTVESSDSAKVGATYKSGAPIGAYSVEVTRLARADQQYFTRGAASGADPQSITIGYADDPTTVAVDPTAGVTVEFAPTATLDDIAAAINANATVPAFASVINNQLVLSGKKTGLDLAVTSAEFAADGSKRREARTAQWKLDNVVQPESLTNTVPNGLPGIDLTLKTVTTSAVTVTVGSPGPDQAAMKAKVKAFVDAYNSTIDLIKGKLDEKSVKSPSTQSDYAKGVLHSDPGLGTVLSKLRAAMGEKVAGNPTTSDTLSDLGISVPSAQASGDVSADRLAGKLVIDDAKLTEALTADPTAIRRLFGGVTGVDGFSQKIDAILDPVASSGSGDLAKRSQLAERETARIKDAQTQMDLRLKLKEERLRAQFTAMETALSQTQSTTSWLSGQINSLTNA